MTDRELLERAAKAAGIEGHFENDGAGAGLFLHNPRNPSVWTRWNPLEDDGDALRLSAKADIQIFRGMRNKCVYARAINGESVWEEAFVHHGDDKAAATRRAIVLAAAELAP